MANARPERNVSYESYKSLATAADFEVTRARLDEELPLLDSAINLDLIQRQASWSEVDSVIKGELGPNGFVALSRIDQGALFSVSGEPCSATRYLVGNPLIARRVITAVPAAALYAPFNAAIYADREGVHVSYDQPPPYSAGSSRQNLMR